MALLDKLEKISTRDKKDLTSKERKNIEKYSSAIIITYTGREYEILYLEKEQAKKIMDKIHNILRGIKKNSFHLIKITTEETTILLNISTDIRSVRLLEDLNDEKL